VNRRKRKENGKEKEKKEKKTGFTERTEKKKRKKGRKRQQGSWAKGKIHGGGRRKTNYIRGNVAGAWWNGESGVFYPYFRH